MMMVFPIREYTIAQQLDWTTQLLLNSWSVCVYSIRETLCKSSAQVGTNVAATMRYRWGKFDCVLEPTSIGTNYKETPQ